VDMHKFFLRESEWRGKGMESERASAAARIQMVIDQWPTSWADDELRFLFFGDFQPPQSPLSFPELEIEISNEHRDGKAVRAHCVLEGKARIKSRDIAGIQDAHRRIELLAGLFTLTTWGNGEVNWWSWLTMLGRTGGVIAALGVRDVHIMQHSFAKYPAPVRQRLRAALYWIREPRRSRMDRRYDDTLNVYSGMWNAFECLVEAACELKPLSKLSRTEKQQKINDLLRPCGNEIEPKDIATCYHEVVNPGLKGRAAHALALCLPKEAPKYLRACFERKPENNRLYNIRNAINHGNIDAVNLDEMARVDHYSNQLWLIVWRLFAAFLRFPAPVDQNNEYIWDCGSMGK